jgi:hypothetical protein
LGLPLAAAGVDCYRAKEGVVNPEDVISEEPGTRKRRNGAPRVAIVAAGAGARGAFEAGALSVLVPWLAKQQLRPTVFVGTSAGSINASLLAGTAELEPDGAAEKLLAFWRSVTVRSVYRSPLLSGPGTVAAYVGQLLGRTFGQPMITSPQLAEKCNANDFLRENVIRYVYENDIAPQLPPTESGAFKHFGTEYQYKSQGDGGEWNLNKEPRKQLSSVLALVTNPLSSSRVSSS